MDRAAPKNAMPVLKPHRSNMRGNTLVVFLAAVFALAVMVGSIYYPFSGKPMSIGTFLQLWFREAILFVLLVVGLIAVAVSRVRRSMKARNDGNQNAL